MMSRVLPIVFVLAALGIFFGYIHPTVTGQIASTQKDITEYDRALNAAKRFDEKQAQLASELKALPPDGIKRLEQFLPNNVNNVQLILDLDALASKSGLKITTFSDAQSVTKTPSSSVDAPPPMTGAMVPGMNTGMGGPIGASNTSSSYDSIDITIGATGSYTQLRMFLDNIEASLQPLDLVELRISDSSTGVYTFTMTFRLYWLR